MMLKIVSHLLKLRLSAFEGRPLEGGCRKGGLPNAVVMSLGDGLEVTTHLHSTMEVTDSNPPLFVL